MKVCGKCGIEIDGKDGENYCPECDSDTPPPKKKKPKTLSRKAREQAMMDIGMVKAKGRLGGTYWE